MVHMDTMCNWEKIGKASRPKELLFLRYSTAIFVKYACVDDYYKKFGGYNYVTCEHNNYLFRHVV